MDKRLEVSSGRTAQRHNILAARALGETIRTTLGPKGMDKMIVGADGSITVTNDGATILEAMDIPHPVARMIAEAAKTQETEVGDGTTTVVVLAAELLKRAEELLDQGMHPTVIIKGYKIAYDRAIEELKGFAKGFKDKDKVLLEIALTAMTGKGVEEQKGELARLAVRTASAVLENGLVRKENIKVLARPGGSVLDSELVNGVILEKERLKEGMPRRIEHPKIALINSPIEVKETEIDSKITISSPEQMERFVEMEESMLYRMVEKILASGANAVVCEKGIDDAAQHQLEKAGIYALRRVKHSDMRLLSRATGGRIVTDIGVLSSQDLGAAPLLEERDVSGEVMCFFSGCKRTATVLLRGGTGHVIQEVERALEDSLGDIGAVLETGKVVGGAGAAEIELARRINKFADTLEGREQLAVRGFAKAMEIIPLTLAENSGLDPIDVLARLKSSHDKGEVYAGINVETGKIVSTLSEGIVEPLKIKTQALSSAIEVATMILRIDDIIVNEPKPMAPSGPLE